SKTGTHFLIVDECHRAGSPANAAALDGTFAATLGLSATPERQYDEGFAGFIEPRLGPIIYDYTYSDAYRDGVIAPFSLVNVRVKMLSDEEARYRRLSRSIGLAMRRKEAGQPGSEEQLKRLLLRRASVSATATMRIPVSIKLVENHLRERAIVFHE